jgi:serine/threonine-protein kinase RsbW
VSVHTRRFANDVAELRRLSEWVRSYAADAGLEEDMTSHVDLSLDEALTNIIRHGYHNRPPGAITVSLETLGDRLRVIVADSGREFNPLQYPAPAVPTLLEAAPVEGLGIHLMRSFADTLEYRREGEQNILTLYFRR